MWFAIFKKSYLGEEEERLDPPSLLDLIFDKIMKFAKFVGILH